MTKPDIRSPLTPRSPTDPIRRRRFGVRVFRSVRISGFGFLVSACTQAVPPPSPLENARRSLAGDQADQAIADADAALRARPHGPEAAQALYVKGVAYYLKGGNRGVGGRPLDPLATEASFHESRTALAQALREQPDKPLEGLVRAELANVAFYQEDFPTAIEQAAVALRLDPPPPPATAARVLFTLGWAQQRLGRFDDADQTFRQVEQAYPSAPEATDAGLHLGKHQFYVQVGTFPSPAAAGAAARAIEKAGAVPAQQVAAGGQTTVSAGPFTTYDDAKRSAATLSRQFPLAAVVP